MLQNLMQFNSIKKGSIKSFLVYNVFVDREKGGRNLPEDILI